MLRHSLGSIHRALALFMLLTPFTIGAARATELLDPTTHPKFVNDLPIPARIDATGAADRGHVVEKLGNNLRFTMEMRESTQWLGLRAPDESPLETTVWGYGLEGQPATSPGPTFVAREMVRLHILWKNMLPAYNSNFPHEGGHLLPVDPTLHMAHPMDGGIPTVTHLHGGHTESASDGLPEAWFTQDFNEVGPHFVKPWYTYDNDQEAATLWYHDHALGITRLNVYAGLAGFYLLRDNNEERLIRKHVLPRDSREIEIVIQDRMFSSDGELFYPSEDPAIEPGFDPLPPGPSAIAEFFGNFIVVNGMVWPKLEVEPRKYRFRLLNGSDSRFYVLEFRDDEVGGNPISFLQIGTDNGLLPMPVQLDRLLMGPGERMDVVVDFNDLAGTEIYLRNFGPDDPFKGFNPDGSLSDGAGGSLPPADPETTGKIMKFVVAASTESPDNDMVVDDDATISLGTRLRPNIKALSQKGATRQLALFEGLDSYGRLQPLLGTLDAGSLAWFEPITENPMVNDVEVWEVYNATEDAHPIHLHLVHFQIINRESFDGMVEEKPQPQHDGSFGVGGRLTVTSLGGDTEPPEPNERGWKDTAIMLPGQVTRVIAKFDREGRYVWHCHILSHEDHEMMRPYQVGPIPEETEGPGPVATRESADLESQPNPFNPATEIRFSIASAGHATLKVYSVKGTEVRTLADRWFTPGPYAITWDGQDNSGTKVPSGVYFGKLLSVDGEHVLRMVMTK